MHVDALYVYIYIIVSYLLATMLADYIATFHMIMGQIQGP